MKYVNVPAERLFIEKKRFNNNRNEYRVDLWREVEKHWLVLGVLLSVMIAVLTPRLGAPGGKLHSELTRYLPLAYIYYSAGQRASCWLIPRRTLLLIILHAHLVAPVLCVVTVTAFRDGMDHRVVIGALLSSIGGGCPWLSIALCQCDINVAALFASSIASIVAVPISSLIMCGTVTISIYTFVTPATVLLPFYLGSQNKQQIDDNERIIIKLMSLFLLYVDCCRRLTEAEGSLFVGDVLGTLLLECSWLCSSVAMCALYYRCGISSAKEAHVIAACSVPKGWEFSTSCPIAGLCSLPGVFLAPAQALFLSAYRCPEENMADLIKNESNILTA